VGSTCASCLDDVVVAWVAPYGIMWEADMPSADVRTATPLSPAFLDQGWDMGRGMSLPFLSDSSFVSRIILDFLEGLMRPLSR